MFETNIVELFDKPSPIKWSRHGNNWSGLFKISEINYELSTQTIDGTEYEVEFKNLSVPSAESQDITGTGNASLVFATILHGIKQWLNTVKPASFMLGAREPSRQKLYKRLLRMLPRNYEVEDFGSLFNVNDTNQMSAIIPSEEEDYFPEESDYNSNMFETKLNNILTELFDKPSPIKWIHQNDDHLSSLFGNWDGIFRVGHHNYQILIDIEYIEDDIPHYEISFGTLTTIDTYGINKSGGNNANLVFATVLHGIKQWLAEVNPIFFMFSAEEPSRQKLYSRMIKMLPRKYKAGLSGKVFFVVDSERVDHARNINF